MLVTAARDVAIDPAHAVELSTVMPYSDEPKTLATCIVKANCSPATSGVAG